MAAMNALSTLRTINNNMTETQGRISSGFKVESGKDNAAYFQIATTMRSESSMLSAVNESMALAKGAMSTARVGAETLTDLAQQFVERVAFASQPGVDNAAVASELTALTEQMRTTISQSSFNGENLLLDASAGTKTVTTGIARAGATLNVTSQDFTIAGLEAQVTALETVAATVLAGTPVEADVQAADAALTAIMQEATALGVAEKAIETQQTFITELVDVLDSGVGAMVDANMEEEAARLQALQVQQQLATQSLSIANQNPQSILALFR
ncbi:flagellin [Roseibacterium sp. SDUM158016]|nr:flagellin [Roseibacterium sp. SDUM158016]MCU4654328.1 flagellin [Roseibacterium sp. SDUM158016]